MKLERKVSSLLRRKEPFFAFTYDWLQGKYRIITSREEYLAELKELREMGMCRRAENRIQSAITVC